MAIQLTHSLDAPGFPVSLLGILETPAIIMGWDFLLSSPDPCCFPSSFAFFSLDLLTVFLVLWLPVGSVNGEQQQQDVGEKGKNIRRVIPPSSFLRAASLITSLSGRHLYTTLSVSGFWRAFFPSLLLCLEVITALGNCILPFWISTPCSHFVNSPFIKLSSSYPI